METIEKQKLSIRFTKELSPGTKLKATDIITKMVTVNEEQEKTLNRILIGLSVEYTDKVLSLYVLNNGKELILENTSTIEKWTIYDNGTVTKFP